MSSLDAVEVDPETNAVKFEKSNFAQVVFHGVSETYPVDAHVECKYTIQASLKPSTSDWIGLYKVGWKSTRDYVYFHWVQLSDGQAGREINGSVLFQAHSLPKDDGEFYQFCFVTSGGHVRGASTPFQFKRPGADDFVTIEDEEADILVVTSKTIALENELSLALLKKDELLKVNSNLEKTRDDLVLKMGDLSKLLTSERETVENMKKENQELSEKVEIMSSEAKDMVVSQDSLKEKINFISKEKDEILKRLEENEVYIKALQDKIKCLLSEKDSLTGRQKMLEEEKELYKNHFTSSEESIQSYLKEINHLKSAIKDQTDQKIKQEQNVCHLESQLEAEKKRLSRQLCITDADQEHIQHLNEKLKNAEDKLCAVEHCKKMLNEEVLAVRAAHDKMAQSLERARSEAHNLKCQVARLEEDSQTETSTLKEEILQLQEENEKLSQEVASLKEKLKEFEDKVKELEMLKTEEESGALYALKTAQAHLEKKLARGRKQNEELRTQMEESIKTQRLQQQVEHDLRREITDLKERLTMGAEEYRVKYLECRRLQHDLKKLRKNAPKSTLSSPEHHITPARVEELMQSSPQSSPESLSSRRESCTQVDAVEPEVDGLQLQMQLDDLGKEFEACIAKKQRYKQLVQEQKDKRDYLIQVHREEQRKLKEQLEITQKQMEDLKAECNHKVHLLEGTVERQKDALEKVKENEGATKLMKKVDYTRIQQLCPYPHVTSEGAVPTTAMPVYIFGNPYAHLVGEEPNPKAIPEAPAPAKLPYPNFGHMSASYSGPEQLPLDKEMESSCQLEPPLTPLPPPMTPEVLPSAKLAAIKAATNARADFQDDEDAAIVQALLDEPEGEEERFQDAAGEPQKICPICNETFPSDHPQTMFEDHVQNHYGPVCPICNEQFPPDCLISKFEEHVELHFSD